MSRRERWTAIRAFALALLISISISASGAAQEIAVRGAQISGRVTTSPDGAPLEYALVTIEGTAIRAVTDSSGNYRLMGVPAGPQVLRVQRIGYAPRRVDVVVPSSGSLEQHITLAQNTLMLQGVRVVADPAGRARGETGTASVIDADAIRSQVAASLAGVLELVPGTPLQPPGLDNVQQISLRASPISGGTDVANDANAQSLSAFGTLLVLDGVPLSNNANLQSLGTRGHLDAGGTAGIGIDLRRLPAATIERVEVIRGVPSARWGDLTHGAVIVDTRAGDVAPEILARLDATTTEVSFLGGSSFGARQTATLTSNAARTRVGGGVRNDESLRLAGQFAHRWTSTSRSAPGVAVEADQTRLTLDTRIDAYQLTDDRPETATLPGAARYSSDLGVRLLERMTLRFANHDQLHITAAIERGSQENWAQRDIVSGVRSMTTRTAPGVEVGRYEGGIYNARADVVGKPTFTYGRAEYLAERYAVGGEHQVRAGLEVRHEANRGAGTQFDLLHPPQADIPGARGYDRPRRFSDIPAFAMTGVYLDDRLTFALRSGAWATIQGGVRLDVLHEQGQWTAAPRSAVLQPRVNAEFSPVRWLSLRAGAGRMAKAPSLNSLHPVPDYYDVVNVNYYANDPAERLTVLTTFVFDPTNPELGHTILDRADASVDVRLGKTYLSLTAYTDDLRGGFGTRPEPAFVVRDIYGLTNVNPGSGTPPDYVADPPERQDTIPVMISRAANNVSQQTSGIELTADFPEIPALRTRIALQGALSRSSLYQDRAEFPSSFYDFQELETIARVPYYRSFRRTGSLGLLTTRITHHQPELGLVVTAVVQHTLYQVRQNFGATDSSAFEGYLLRNGTLVPVPIEDRDDPQYADLRVPRALGTGQSRAEPDWLLSLQVAKSLPLGGRFSFYAFNAFDRPGKFGGFDSIQNVYSASRFGMEVTLPLGPFAMWRRE